MDERECLRCFLLPYETRFVAIDADRESVRLAGADLLRGERNMYVVLGADVDARVVIEYATINKACQVGADLGRCASGDESCQMLSVRADVAECARDACPRGIDPP